MPRFNYTAIDVTTARECSGELERADADTAVADLKARGLFPTALRSVEDAASGTRTPTPVRHTHLQGHGPRRRFRRAAGSKELTIFTRQLSALVSAGMPMVRSLDLLARQERNPAWQAVIVSLADAIRAGGTLTEGLNQHPKVFGRLYVGMVKAGESGGMPDVVLERLARHLEKTGRIKARVKAAMTYPMVIMIVAAAIVTGLMVFVVPRFERIFAGVLRGAPLPALTRGVLDASRLIQNHWLVGILVVILLVGCGSWLRRTRTGVRLIDRLVLRIPVGGELVRKVSVARFSRTLGTMLASGVPVLQALQLTRDTSGNCVVAESIDAVQRRVREGESVAQPLAATDVFPPVVTGMVAVGEETGTLPAMLTRIADIYDEEVDNAVAGLTSLIEPIMIVLMAVIVGTIVIALFLPIIRIIQMLGT